MQLSDSKEIISFRNAAKQDCQTLNSVQLTPMFLGFCFFRTMWNQGSDQNGQVAVRMETTPSPGSASISVSQQQAPKKFAPVVAPKPKFNPYKQMGEPAHLEAAGEHPGRGSQLVVSVADWLNQSFKSNLNDRHLDWSTWYVLKKKSKTPTTFSYN